VGRNNEASVPGCGVDIVCINWHFSLSLVVIMAFFLKCGIVLLYVGRCC
jgi:hypothetical protein